ncbi:MAG: hypothetical protein HY721_09505 [Planctomycetes bacterium]|nr:hypothetical protein [Planctomycetota bacterium]
MTLSRFGPEHETQARQVTELLQSIAGEVDVAMDPHRIALRALHVDPMGCVKVPYDKEAFRVWTDLHRRDPGDLLTLHHLAILHHARAFDLEAGKEPAKANADWEEALKLWHGLWKADAFWARIADRASRGAKRDPVDRLREQLPEILLQVHYDIAFDGATKNFRAQYHVAAARSSPFPEEALAKVRKCTYARVTALVPPNVWSPDELNPDVIDVGLKAIRAYLEKDPGYVPALEDALRLEVRLLRAWYTDLQALGEEPSPKRTSLLETMQHAAQAWRPYLDQLVPQAGSLDDDVRQKLSLWYRVVGDVFCALEGLQDALHFYEQGARGGIAGDPDTKRCEKAIGEVHARLAREAVVAKAPGARARCDAVRSRKGLSLHAHFVLANAYGLLEDFAAAKEVCHAGLRLAPDEAVADPREVQAFEEGRSLLQQTLVQLEVQELIHEAGEHMNAQRFGEALKLLDRAAPKGTAGGTVFFLRAQCLAALDEFEKARRDLAAFRREAGQDAAARKAGDDLEGSIRTAEDLTRRFGTGPAARLRGESVDAYNAGRHEEAARLLRKAIEASAKPGLPHGAPALKEDLALVLTDAAMNVLSDAGAHPSLEALRRAKAMLDEAAQAAPKAQRVVEAADLRKGVAARIEGIAVHGNARAHGLRQNAVEAFTAQRFEEAIRLLREALEASKPEMPGGAPALKKDLSMVLAGAAVSAVNALGDAPSAAALARARRMLEEAVSLDGANQGARDNLAALTNLERGSEVIRAHGNARAHDLQQQAVQVFNGGDAEAAIRLLREAIDASKSSVPGGAPALKKELSMVLAGAAVEEVNEAGPRGDMAALVKALARLQEAVQLDPQNQHARQNLEILKQMLGFGGGPLGRSWSD